MYFFFSKVLYFAILPGNWILLLLIISFIAKSKTARIRLRIAAVIVYLIFACPFLLKTVGNWWDYKPDKMDPNKQYSCAIVLGGFSSFNDDGSGYFNNSGDRFIQTLKLKAEGRVQKVLITGGSGKLVGNKFAEAPWVKQQFVDFKVPASDVLIEGQSKNTKENAQFSRDTLNKNGIKGPYILVTSAFHMRRSFYIFKKAGLDVIAYPCNYTFSKTGFSILDLFPDVGTLGDWSTYLKEIVGYIVAHFQKMS